MTYLSPTRLAVVRMPETSEPASGSVRQKEASRGSSTSIPRYCFLSSSEPPSTSGAAANWLAPSVVAIAAQPQASSSPIRQPSRYEAPTPPYATGSWGFISPSSQALVMITSGQVPSLSYSHATGRIAFSAKSWASARMFSCSSVRVKLTIVVPRFGSWKSRSRARCGVLRRPLFQRVGTSRGQLGQAGRLLPPT